MVDYLTIKLYKKSSFDLLVTSLYRPLVKLLIMKDEL
jgi:hypothetical protein